MEPGAPQGNPAEKAPRSIQEAIDSVQCLIKTPLDRVDSPVIEAVSQALHYDINMNTNFADRNAFAPVVAKFQEELSRQAKLVELLDEAQQYAAMLYTWRSCSLGIPMIKSNAQENRMDIYHTTYDILKPEVDKLKRMYAFQKRAVHQFCEEMKHVCQERSMFISDEYLHTLGQFINMFAVLDELLNIKASVKNDYSSYKRAAGILKKVTDPKEMQASEQFSMFLATNNSILNDVKGSMKGVQGYEGLMCDIINTCVEKYEEKIFLKAREKHALVKVIGFCLHLIDGEHMNINRIDSKKKLNLNKIDKILKQVEVVPLFGDMMIGPFKYIENTPNYDPFKWSHCLSEEDSTQSQIDQKQMNQMRQEYVHLVSYITSLCHIKGQIQDINKKFGKRPGPNLEMQVAKGDQENQELYELALTSLQRLASWTGCITELFSWKLLHPADPSINRSCPKESENYERATKYNYTAEEKQHIVEIIAMVKSVQRTLSQLEHTLKEAVIKHVYTELQQFVQVALREPLRKAVKQKKDIIKSTLFGIREICTDLLRNMDPSKDPLLVRMKKDSDTGYKVQIDRKQIPPSSTQLYLLRTMLESLVEKKDKNTGRKTPRKDLDSSSVSLIENFLRKSQYWHYVLDYGASLMECCDLSQLWYREFYLEMTKGERIQFPIEMSMPWILTDHILGVENMIEYVLYPLDLYNDCASCALHVFKKQFLFDEIEAEVNLCFDQFVYKLSNQIFDHFKKVAASIVLDRTFRSNCQKLGYTIKHPSRTKYITLLQKTNVQLLGRSVDLNHLIAQRMNESILKCLNIAIGRFEAGPIPGVMELQGMIDCNRLTHRQLSQYLVLDEFDAMLQEANHTVSSPLGRISQHVFLALNADFMPQLCYNASTARFVKTVLPFVDQLEYNKPPSADQRYLWGSKSLSNIYSTLYSQYSHFVGAPHFQAIVQLIGYQDIAAIFKEIQKVIQNIIEDTVVPYIKTLMGVMPKRCKMPRYEYTSPGILEYYQAQLQDIMMYSDLQPKVFQVLRETGNAILFCLHLEQALIQKEILEINHAAMFQHVIPKPYIKKKGKSKEEIDKELKHHMKEMETRYKYQNVVPIIKKLGSEEQQGIVQQSSILTREKLCCGLSIFSKVLEQVRLKLSDPVFQGQIPAHGVLDVVENLEFHRLWSAVQFVFCLPQRGNEYTVEQLFGEGLNWAGCTLLSLLGQHRRFECMDYTYHLLKVHRVDQVEKNCKGVSVSKMADRIRKFQILNDQIFSVLDKYSSDGKSSIIEPRKIVHHEPPRVELDLPDIPDTAGIRESLA